MWHRAASPKTRSRKWCATRKRTPAEDKQRKEEVEERNLADSAAYRAEKSIAELGDKITSEQKGELETKIADVRAALSTDDVQRIKASREALEQAFYKISESIYRQAGASGGRRGRRVRQPTKSKVPLPTTPSKANTRKCNYQDCRQRD